MRLKSLVQTPEDKTNALLNTNDGHNRIKGFIQLFLYRRYRLKQTGLKI